MNPGRHGTKDILVVGAGLTGLATATRLQRSYRLFEAEAEPGGLARTSQWRGFHFDRTGHWFHARTKEVRSFLQEVLPDGWMTVSRKAKAFSYGVETAYPFQLHLHGHDRRTVYECLLGLWKAREERNKSRPRTFEEFILRNFGPGISRYFLVPYNEKLWGVHPSLMTADWCQRFVPVPDLSQVLAGALGLSLDELGYNIEFLYPKEGGIGALARAMAQRLDRDRVHFNARVERIDHRRHRLLVAGQWHDYDSLVSTMPLPELIRTLLRPPPSVEQAASRLKSTGIFYLDAGIKNIQKDYHWVYVPEKRHPFYRVGIYSNAIPSMAPKGQSSLYIELADRSVTLSDDELLRLVAPGLVEMGIIESIDDILFVRKRHIPYAYVIYDEAYRRARTRLLRFLERHDIYSAGRYGSWVYNSMEDSILEGFALAKRLSATPRRNSGDSLHG